MISLLAAKSLRIVTDLEPSQSKAMDHTIRRKYDAEIAKRDIPKSGDVNFPSAKA
jgi:hypothetical protein